jgi:hypothetical protein
VLCTLPAFDLVFAIEYATAHDRCSMRLWLGLCLNGGPDPAILTTWCGFDRPSGAGGGWESSQMVRRDAHFSAARLAVYADALPTISGPCSVIVHARK